MAFNVGDWVKVKDPKDSFQYFTIEMCGYCGKIYKIRSKETDFPITYYTLEGCVNQDDGTYIIFFESSLEQSDALVSLLDKSLEYVTEVIKEMEDKEMNKQKTKLAERTRIKDKMAEYIYKSDVRAINVIVPDQVVEVEFNDYSDKIKTVCSKDDTFSLERAMYIAIAKKRFGHIYTSEGIEKKATELTYEKDYVYRVKNALKVYECQQKLAALDKEEEEIKLRQKQKRHDRNERRRARRAEERKNEQIAIQKEAYLHAMREFEEEKTN